MKDITKPNACSADLDVLRPNMRRTHAVGQYHFDLTAIHLNSVVCDSNDFAVLLLFRLDLLCFPTL
jgi:hypothetical protein